MSKELSRRRLLLSLGAAVGLSMVPSFAAAEDVIDAPAIEDILPKERPDLSERGGPRPTEEPECVVSGDWVGICTYYMNGAGCVGCSPGEIMANGQKFNQWANTIAFMKLPLNTLVRVTNLDNGKSVIAKVTDRGGFEKYGILADLSLGVSRAIENRSQGSRIRINTLDCE